MPNREAVSSGTGTYVFSLVPVGTYVLKIEKIGFNTVQMEDLRLGVGDNRVVDIPMEVAGSSVTVTVESRIAPLERSTAAVGSVIGGEQISGIPVNGQHWATLMMLAPGAINTGEGNQQSIRFVGRARTSRRRREGEPEQADDEKDDGVSHVAYLPAIIPGQLTG